MKIRHRINLSTSMGADAIDALAAHGLQLEIEGPLATIVITEDDPRWAPAVADILAAAGAGHYVDTLFDAADFAVSEWVTPADCWTHGYPQPEEGENSYDAGGTYDATGACAACGAGLVQCHPFRMKAEPRWGTRSIMQLEWVGDEYFIRPDHWARLVQDFEIRTEPVLRKKGAGQLENVRQIRVDDSVSIDTRGLPSRTCPTCGRQLFAPVTRGAFPAIIGTSTAPAVRTKEYFNPGGRFTFQLVYLRKDLMNAIKNEKLRGANFAPVSAE